MTTGGNWSPVTTTITILDSWDTPDLEVRGYCVKISLSDRGIAVVIVLTFCVCLERRRTQERLDCGRIKSCFMHIW